MTQTKTMNRDSMTSIEISHVMADDNDFLQKREMCASILPLTMTVEEATSALNLSKPVVYELTRQPGFPCFNVGKKILINRARLQEWIDEQCDTY